MAVLYCEPVVRRENCLFDENPMFTIEQLERAEESTDTLFFHKKKFYNNKVLMFSENMVYESLAAHQRTEDKYKAFFTRKTFDTFINPMRDGTFPDYLYSNYGFAYGSHYNFLDIHSIFKTKDRKYSIVCFPIESEDVNMQNRIQVGEDVAFTGTHARNVYTYHSGHIDRWNYFTDRLRFEFFWGRC